MANELTGDEQRLLAREIAAEDYERKWPITSSYGNWAKDAFIAGWNAREQYDHD